MHITIINDCRDANAAGRQITRASTLFNAPASLVGVQNDQEAAGNLIDILDAYGEKEGVVLVNVAPRHGAAKKWENGTPFGYFRYKNILILASVDGYTLSLVKKLGLTNEIQVLDIPSAVEALAKAGEITDDQRDYIIRTQFRSFDFLPRAGAFLAGGGTLPTTPLPISEVADIPPSVWWIDNFGNCKTTLLEKDVPVSETRTVRTQFGELKYYSRLKDVPNKATALITGSSGLGDDRFLELVIQGESAEKKFGIASGAEIV